MEKSTSDNFFKNRKCPHGKSLCGGGAHQVFLNSVRPLVFLGLRHSEQILFWCLAKLGSKLITYTVFPCIVLQGYSK